MLVKDSCNIEIHLLKIEIEKTGHLTNTYVVKNKKTNKLLVVDPAYDGKNIIKELEIIGGILEIVVVTHSHADHIAGLARLVNGTDVKVYLHSLDKAGLNDAILNEREIVKTEVEKVDDNNVINLENGDKIKFGNVELNVMHTPGHTQGSMVLYNKEENVLFSGDTIFANTYGRTDLIASKPECMKETLDRLFDEFDDIQVFPGHGEIFDLEKAKRKIKLLFAFKDGR